MPMPTAVMRMNRPFLPLFLLITLSGLMCFTGCSAGKQGLLSITPQQYFYSAKERLEIIDERNYDIKDLDEIIRVLENAEKDAKSAEIMDKSRMYLVLANTLKARKQFMENRMKGQFIANRAQPFFTLDTKPINETLRVAKKWLRSCEAQFKSASLLADLQFVKAMYFTQKLLTQKSRERRESLWTAVDAYRRCLGAAPDYKSDFRLFGRIQGPREVRIKLIECLAYGGEVADAFFLVSEYAFSPASSQQDYPWIHLKGLVLAFMGRYQESQELLARFKIVPPQEYPQVDEALWVLEGVYDRLHEESGEDRYRMEGKIVASQLKRLKGPFSKEKYTTAAHVFPRWLPGDLQFFSALTEYNAGNLEKAAGALAPLWKSGLLSRANRLAARVIAFEAAVYAGKSLADELLADILEIAYEPELSPLMKERIGFLLARYTMADLHGFKTGLRESEGQTFARTITGKPWAININLNKRPDNLPVSGNADADAGKNPPGDGAVLFVEAYANRPEDWLTSANITLLSLPEFALVGKGRLVGKEEEGKGWVFRGSDIDELLRRDLFLAIFEYTDSDSEKSHQGALLRFSPRMGRRRLFRF
jgi:hypothetical protein